LNAFLAENILGMKVVHLFNRQPLHRERFSKINEWYTEAQIGSVKVFAYFQPTVTLCSGVAIALVIYFGGNFVREGELPLGILVAYFSYVLALFHPVRELVDKWNIFLSGIASAERIFSILDWPTEQDAESLSQADFSPAKLKGKIVFDQVWFAYSEENWVLKDFSLVIESGMKVGIVGHSGAGKSTLIGLLMRFYEPQRGRILLDGRDIREWTHRELRAAIGLVQQDVFLFSGSIQENIHLWRSASGENLQIPEVQNLLSKFYGMDSTHPEKEQLQERGNNLSMGERQLLAFARVVASRPAIWILDEATANVDSESERVLEIALRRASEAKTTLMIAHRLATVRDCDLILTLHKGALIEKGRHSELLQKDGLYARLYRYQSALKESQVALGE
jgi:ATP-binding cassette subfamily B protein